MYEESKEICKPNPKAKASIFSIATFWYVLPIIIDGYKRTLSENDLYEVSPDTKSSILGNELENIWKTEEENATRNGKEPSLKKALMKLFWPELLGQAIFVIFCDAIWFIQPVFLEYFLKFYDPDQSTVSTKDAYLYALGIILCSALFSQMMHHYFFNMLHLGLKTRIACCSLMYRKSMKLSKTSLGKATAGHIFSLLSNDANKLSNYYFYWQYVWLVPLECVVTACLAYLYVDYTAFVGVSILVAFLPILAFLGYLATIFGNNAAIKTDERLRLTNEVISRIKIIKMYVWEKTFSNFINGARRLEMQSIQRSSYTVGLLISCAMFCARLAMFGIVAAYVFFGHPLSGGEIFVVFSAFNVIRYTITFLFPQAMAFLAEGNICLGRMNSFLLLDETVGVKEMTNNISEERDETKISMHKVRAKWSDIISEATLEDISLRFRAGELVALVGPLGSGKSTILQVILKDVPLCNGFLRVNGTLSHASQEPWLFAGTIKENILFGLQMDERRYREVVRVCALERDFELLPHGDETIISEAGNSLSGGQQTRINLARAVYRQADIYLLDDPLSSLDVSVAKHIFEECLKSFLREKTVVLCTSQLHRLQEVDQIVYLKNGYIIAKGSYEEVTYQMNGDIENLFKDSGRNPYVGNQEMITNLIPTKETSPQYYDKQSVYHEHISKRSIGIKAYINYFSAAGYFVVATVLMFFLLSQTFAGLADYFVAYWLNLESDALEESKNIRNFSNHSRIQEASPDYMESAGAYPHYAFYTYYGIICAILVISTIIRSTIYYYACTKASERLHRKMLSNVMKTTLNFFSINGTGRILNRFSADMGIVDTLLPFVAIEMLQYLILSLGVALILIYIDIWLIFPTIIIFGTAFYITYVYGFSGRDLKRLEGITRSPVLRHLSDSLRGLTTIRASGMDKKLVKEFDSHQDLHSAAWYTLIATSKAFGFWIDILCIIYITIVVLKFLIVRREDHVADVAVAITQSITLSNVFQWSMRQFIELECSMTSVERIKEYDKIETEATNTSKALIIPPKNWPKLGRIHFKNVFLHYFPTEPPVLKNLNFTIYPREKIGIVGRTGSGKTSLINALFRLANLKGSIIVDDINICNISLDDLRSNLSIIPQENALFSGTLRKNLDPSAIFSDEELYEALEKVELKNIVANAPDGLNFKTEEGGQNFSLGQKQLICLARAFLNKRKILIMDEPSAKLDPHSEKILQLTLENEFRECTVLIVAHRLSSIMDSDRVMLLDSGEIKEFDHPYKLLQNQSGLFYAMVQQSGSQTAKYLCDEAERNYINRSIQDEYEKTLA